MKQPRYIDLTRFILCSCQCDNGYRRTRALVSCGARSSLVVTHPSTNQGRRATEVALVATVYTLHPTHLLPGCKLTSDVTRKSPWQLVGSCTISWPETASIHRWRHLTQTDRHHDLQRPLAERRRVHLRRKHASQQQQQLRHRAMSMC